MAIGYIEADQLTVFTMGKELRVKHAVASTAYWPLICFGKLCNSEESYDLVTKFVFDLELQPAITRVLKLQNSKLDIFERLVCEEKVSDVEGRESREL